MSHTRATEPSRLFRANKPELPAACRPRRGSARSAFLRVGVWVSSLTPRRIWCISWTPLAAGSCNQVRLKAGPTRLRFQIVWRICGIRAARTC